MVVKKLQLVPHLAVYTKLLLASDKNTPDKSFQEISKKQICGRPWNLFYLFLIVMCFWKITKRSWQDSKPQKSIFVINKYTLHSRKFLRQLVHAKVEVIINSPHELT